MPFFERLRFHFEADAGRRLQMFLGQEVDAFELSDEQYSEWAIGSPTPPGYAVAFSQSQYNVVLWNIARRPELFGDPKVRRALAHAFNLAAAMKKIGLDPHDQVASVFPVRSWACELVPEPYGYDPDLAKRLLRDAGWKLRDDMQIITSTGGRPVEFRFSVLVSQDSLTSVKVVEDWAASLRKIGIALEVETRPRKEVDDKRDDRAFDATVCGLLPAIDPGLDRHWWHSQDEGATKALTPVSCGYQNIEVDRLFDEADATLDLAKRREAYVTLQQLIYEDQPVMFLYHRPAKWALSKRLRGVEFGIRGPFGFHPSVRAWWTPKTSP